MKDEGVIKKLPAWNWLIAAAGVMALAAALPLFLQPGLLNTRGGGDSPFLLQRVQQLETALGDGHFPARWMPDANYGYGYPFYHFYAPLSLYITAVFRLFGFSYVGAIEAAQTAGFLVAAIGIYLLARRWWGNEWVALLTAVAYTFAPFHLVNIYVRGDSLAEFWAMAWYPWVILAADRLTRDAGAQPGQATWGGLRQHRGHIAALALAYAALILSHNISALIFSPFLLLYLLLNLAQKLAVRDWRLPAVPPQSRISGLQSLLPPLLALLLAFALAAWFFVPALAEQHGAQLQPVTQGYFHYSNHFRGWELVQGSLLFDYDVADGRAFRMGLVQAATAVLGLLVWLWIGRVSVVSSASLSRAPLLFTLLTLLIATFMITPLSRPLWDHLPLLPFTQFPWRFLSVQAFGAALATGGLALLPRKHLLVPLWLALLAISGLGALRTDSLPLTDVDVTAVSLAQYEWFTGNIGSTVSAEYLPPAATPRPYTSSWLNTGQRHALAVLHGEISGSNLTLFKTDEQVWQITAVSPATLQFPTLYWPGWVAQVNGAQVEIRPLPGSGLIMLDVPAGVHTIRLRLTRTPLRLAAELLSLVALALTLFLLWPVWGKRPFWRRAALVGGALLLLALAARLWPQPALPANTLNWDLAQMGYLHHAPDGIPFANGARLRTYNYDREAVRPGETLTIVVHGQQLAEAEAALLTPAVLRWPQLTHVPLVIARAEKQGEALLFRLLVPADAPPGLYAPRLRLADAPALTPSGQGRGDLFLRPVRVLAVPETAVLPQTALADVRLTQFEVIDGWWTAHLQWAAARPLGQNYNASLRFLDEAGNLLAHFDAQPGYGYLPSSLWPAGQWVADRLTFALPEALPPTGALMAQLYEIGGQTVLYRRLGLWQQGEAGWQIRPYLRQFALPEGVTERETAVFLAEDVPVIQLRAYQTALDGDALALTLHWQALNETPRNYTRFVHLLDGAGNLRWQADGMAQGNSYPTSQWQRDEIISERIHLPLSALPPEGYQIVVGWYENLGDAWPRLTAVAADGSSFAADAVPLRHEP